MSKYAVILAGGIGRRAGGDTPKQFRMLGGKPVLWWSLKAFHDEDPETDLVVVLHEDCHRLWNDLLGALPEEERFPHRIVTGGKERTDSVQAGLSVVQEEGPDSLVAVHDGARPLVSPAMIARGWEKARVACAAVPAVPLSDSIRRLHSVTSGSGYGPSSAVDRSSYVAVQTPQIFDLRLLRKAYAGRREGKVYTDDASLVEDIVPVALYEGEQTNMKITNPQDFRIAEVIMDMRK